MPCSNTARDITEGLDYEAFLSTGYLPLRPWNFGTLMFTLNGNYLARFVTQAQPQWNAKLILPANS